MFCEQVEKICTLLRLDFNYWYTGVVRLINDTFKFLFTILFFILFFEMANFRRFVLHVRVFPIFSVLFFFHFYYWISWIQPNHVENCSIHCLIVPSYIEYHEILFCGCGYSQCCECTFHHQPEKKQQKIKKKKRKKDRERRKHAICSVGSAGWSAWAMAWQCSHWAFCSIVIRL